MKHPFIYPDGRMDTKNAALYTGLSVKTLAQWRSQGIGPKFVKPTPSRVFYFKEDLDEWLNRNGRASSTAQARYQDKSVSNKDEK